MSWTFTFRFRGWASKHVQGSTSSEYPEAVVIVGVSLEWKTWHVTKIEMIYLAFLLLLWRNRQSEFFWSDSAEPRISVDHKQWPTLLIPLTFTFTIRHKLRHGFNGEFYWYKNICWDTIIIAIVVSAFTPTKHDILLVAQKAMIYGPHDRWRNVICPLWIDFITIHQVTPSCRSVALKHHQV